MKNRVYILIGLVGIAVAFQGCVAKKYVRPDVVATNATYRGVEASDTTSFASVNWQEYYSDPNLVALIKVALDSNLDVRAAESNIRAAQEYLKQAKAAFYPTIGLGGSFGVSGAPGSNGNLIASASYSVLAQTLSTTQASWEIDLWGKLASAKRAQAARLKQSEAYYNAVKTEVVASVASAYYTLQALDAMLAIYEASALTRRNTQDVVTALKDAGQSTDIAVNQAAAQYYYVMGSIPQIKMQIAATENVIWLLLGGVPTEIQRSTLLTYADSQSDLLNVGVPAQLLANRPDVMAAEYELIAAHEQWNVARAAMYPSLVISGNVGIGGGNLAGWFAWPGSFIGQLLAGITAPIFNGRQLRTARNVAAETKYQAALNFKKSMLTAQKEVSDAISSYQQTKESIKYQRQQVIQLDKAVGSSEEMLKSGYASYLDLLYAADNELTASLNLVDVRLQNAKSRVELYRALGGGWK